MALALVYRIRDKFQNCSVIWIPATNMESLHQTYLDVARQLKIPGSDDDKADAKKLVQGYLSQESAGRWLLLFDNADDVNMWTSQSSPGSGRLVDYLPRSEQGCIVFTTRDRKTAVKLAQQSIVEVPEMDEIAGIQLLRNSLVNPDLTDNTPATKTLLEELTFLPLAIAQSVAYINENGIEFAQYLSLLAEQEEDVIDILSEEFEDDGRHEHTKNPVATTWLISFEQIRNRDPLAAEYLSFMACIDPKDIPQSLLPAAGSRKKGIDAIGTLEAYSFIIKRAADRALDLHRLVHFATRSWLQQNDRMAQWAEKAIVRVEEVFPTGDHENRTEWRAYLIHAHYVLNSNLVEREFQSRMDLLWRYGMCLYEDGRWNEAEAAIAEVLEIEMRDFGKEHPDTLTSMSNLASTIRKQGRWKEAEDLEVQVIETRKRVLGAEHPDTLTSMANLAVTFWDQGRWKEAEDLQVQVMATRKRVLGAEHSDSLTSMNNLAFIWKGLGRDKEAIELMKECVALRTRTIGVNHPQTLSSGTTLLGWRTEELEIRALSDTE